MTDTPMHSSLPELKAYCNELSGYLSTLVASCKNKKKNIRENELNNQNILIKKITNLKMENDKLNQSIFSTRDNIKDLETVLEKDGHDLTDLKNETVSLEKQLIALNLQKDSLINTLRTLRTKNRATKSEITHKLLEYSKNETIIKKQADWYKQLLMIDIQQEKLETLRITFYFLKHSAKKYDVESSNDKSNVELDHKNVDKISEQSSFIQSDVENVSMFKNCESVHLLLDFKNSSSGYIQYIKNDILSLDTMNYILEKEKNFYSFLKRIRQMIKEKIDI
ncbi:hypothetical protein M153_3560006008 [Pseudoloma neurophilia]|uniref:Uncharacterized protein n=1 Tax=Pseudoloma neurophilia TaxID=146866 RepID=A0A0R0LXX3_9MICR|nr:hypothetical protein M153_3560006008 [Pseudoloma neurophilia]